LETARQLLQKGYYIYLGSRDLQKGKDAVDMLRGEGLTQIEPIAIDISNGDSIHSARQVLWQKIDKLDLLVNNAGIAGNFPQNPSTTPTDDMREVFNTNVFGTIDVTQAFLSLLEKSETPVIVNVTSGLASLTLHSEPSWMYYQVKSASYGPSKTALNAYTIALAHELREKGFKINAVDPGFTATDFNHHTGHGTVEAAAAFVVRYSILDSNGPTGRFFSHDYQENENESPW